MGEQPLKELVKQIENGASFSGMTSIPQTAFIADASSIPDYKNEREDVYLFSHEECEKDKLKQAKNFKVVEEQSNMMFSSRILQKYSNNQTLVINPPYPPMTEKEIDASFDLPYTRLPHPKYKNKTIPAFEMIKFSVNLHRGCFGGCAFCTISAHQGKFISSRSKKSIIEEVKKITKMPDFKGYLSDLGGPSANMYAMKGFNEDICKKCKRPSCIDPNICNNLNIDHSRLLDIYSSVDSLSDIKKSFIGSGVRYDLLLHESTKKDRENVNFKTKEYTKELVLNHVSGRLKVAPEHTSSKVLGYMRKPAFKQFYEFKRIFDDINRKAGLKQQIIPYFISSHPGCTELDMAELAIETKSLGFNLEQVQDFTPSPMTLATEIYYTGYHPYTLEKVYSARSKDQKLAQRQYFFWYDKEYRPRITRSLQKLKREDLLKKLYSFERESNKSSLKENRGKEKKRRK